MSLRDTEDRYSSGLYPKRPVALVRGTGVRVWDADGREYIDCTSGIGVTALGHAHPVVLDAIHTQAERLITCHELFYNDQRAQLLARLADVTPPALHKFFLSNSGSEANEAALKFARASTGRPEIVSAMRGYHGKTMGALSATWEKKYRTPFEPLVPGFRSIPFNDTNAAEAAVGDQTAAVIIEVVQGESGVRPATREFLEGLRALCTDRGALLIIDEVQTGFGRTGRLFAVDHHDIVPDILTLAKSAAGGLPIGITAFGDTVRNLTPLSHTTTFGGNPLVCAVADRVIAYLVSASIPQRAATQGDYFLGRLRQLDSRLIRDVRGLGLMIGVELKHPAAPYARQLIDEGVLALLAGTTVLRFLPPLIIDTADIDHVVDAMARVLA